VRGGLLVDEHALVVDVDGVALTPEHASDDELSGPVRDAAAGQLKGSLRGSGRFRLARDLMKIAI
jgi:hypothetical protein